MDAELFERIEAAVRCDMTAEQVVRIEAAARETSAARAVAVLLGEKALALGESRQCPHCGSGGAIKWGRDRRGLQRFQCRGEGCGKHFTPVSDTCLSGMRMPEKWVPFVASLADRRSLEKIGLAIGISRKTAFAWRRRLLGAAARLPQDSVGGIVEADETFFLRSFKGHRGWKKGNPPENRPARYRGSGALKRGLSGEQVPVLTAVDNSRRIIQAVLPNRRDEEILAVLADRVEPGSVICSDGLAAYPKLAEARSCEHRAIERSLPTPEEKVRGLARGRRARSASAGSITGMRD